MRGVSHSRLRGNLAPACQASGFHEPPSTRALYLLENDIRPVVPHNAACVAAVGIPCPVCPAEAIGSTFEILEVRRNVIHALHQTNETEGSE
jgi:hypothetical protein